MRTIAVWSGAIMIVGGLWSASAISQGPADEPAAPSSSSGVTSETGPPVVEGESALPADGGEVQARAVPQLIRLQNVWQPSQYVHIQNGPVEAGPISVGWTSARWTLEGVAAPGVAIYHIRNVWQGDRYLNIEPGALQASTIQPGWLSARWYLEIIPGSTAYRIRNVWKPDQYLHIQNGKLEAGAIQPGWLSAMWKLGFDATVVAAPTPGPTAPAVTGAGTTGVTGTGTTGPTTGGTLAPPDKPIPCPPTQGVRTVTTAKDLKDTLDSNFTGTILIPSGAEIDLDGPRLYLNPYRDLPVKSCVQIKGTRNGLDPGALLFTHVKKAGPVFVVTGHDVRIEGLRFQGPIPTYTDADRAIPKPELYVTAIDIRLDPSLGAVSNVVIDNNNFWFWTQAISVGAPPAWVISTPYMTKYMAGRISVTRNYLHRNGRDGAGYGVNVGGGAYVLIEGNLFDHNRHAVTSGGGPYTGYIARYNYVLEGGFMQGGFYNQHFDVHGTIGGYGGVAGEYFEIAFNTIRGEQTYYVVKTRPAFMLRGQSSDRAYFHDNVLVHDNAGAAVSRKTTYCETISGEYTCREQCSSNAQCNLTVGPNTYNTDTTFDLAVGDFDGDGTDDVFLANGTGWWYSSAGLTEWRFLRASEKRIKDLRFGHFDAVASTDVLFSTGSEWYFSSGGTAAPVRLRVDNTPLAACVFGDFDGNGLTDALMANGTTWSLARDARTSWLPVRSSPVTAANLRVGNFIGDRRDEILFISGEVMAGPIKNKVWSFWQYGSTTLTQINAILGNDITSLVVADFNGDGYADVAQTDGDGWRYSRSGSSPWARLRGSGGQGQYKDIGAVLFGRFAQDGKPNALRFELVEQYNLEGTTVSYVPGPRFVLWTGIDSPDAFQYWTPPLQEMR